jgi:dipeptidyl-peptidase-3
VIGSIFDIPPYAIGYPDDRNQSGYYLGEQITRDEIAQVSQVLEKHRIEPENTRMRKLREGSGLVFEVLQASVQCDSSQRDLEAPELDAKVRLVRGDHTQDLSKVCSALQQAIKYASNKHQETFLCELLKSFQTGSLNAYREALKAWLLDAAPKIETILGFVEPIRDPHGVRAEWEGIITISDEDASAKLKDLVRNSTKYVRTLPWAVEGVNDGKGPFEPARFEAPELTVVHGKTLPPVIVT